MQIHKRRKGGWRETGWGTKRKQRWSKSVRTLFGWTALSEETFSSVFLFFSLALHLVCLLHTWCSFSHSTSVSLAVSLSQVSPFELLIFNSVSYPFSLFRLATTFSQPTSWVPMLFVVQSTNTHTNTQCRDFHSVFLFKEREETITTMSRIVVPIFCPREPLGEVLCLPGEGSFIWTISVRRFIRAISALTVLTPVTHSWPHGSAKGFSIVFFHSCNQMHGLLGTLRSRALLWLLKRPF